MLRIINLEGIESLLLEIPSIIQKFGDREPDFLVNVEKWLARVENALSENRMIAAAGIAALRGTLLSSGQSSSNHDRPLRPAVTRRMKEAHAVTILRQATQMTSEAVGTRRLQVDEAERVMGQMVAVAYQLGFVQTETGNNHTAYLLAVKQVLLSRNDLASLVTHVVGLVGNIDFLMLLDRALTAWNAR